MLKGRPTVPMIERFCQRVTPVTDVPCLLWLGTLSKDGYGVIAGPRDASGHKRQWGAHVYAWTITHGPVPPGLFVCHHCDVRCCVNAEGCLFLGTHLENMQDMITKGRTSRLVGERSKFYVGEAHPRARLTEVDVRAIRSSSGVRLIDLAEQYGVSKATINAVIQRQNWKHLD